MAVFAGLACALQHQSLPMANLKKDRVLLKVEGKGYRHQWLLGVGISCFLSGWFLMVLSCLEEKPKLFVTSKHQLFVACTSQSVGWCPRCSESAICRPVGTAFNALMLHWSLCVCLFLMPSCATWYHALLIVHRCFGSKTSDWLRWYLHVHVLGLETQVCTAPCRNHGKLLKGAQASSGPWH